VRAVRGGDHVAVLERAADSDRYGFLADRNVQETRQLAGSEALFDLLLEAPNQQHLAEEIAQLFLRKRASLLNLCHGAECTLRPVPLVDDFNRIEHELPDDWGDAQLLLTVDDDGRCDRASALLGPANPGRLGTKIRFAAARRGAGLAPDAIRRLLHRLDDEGIDGELQLVGTTEAPKEELRERRSLRDAWEHALATLPHDWSDLYAEVRLDSTDYLERAALLLAPLNPARYGGHTGLRFRCARQFGYGASPGMVSRCSARCDEEGITGDVEILYALSDTYPVATQGPVWYVAGHSV
jgi:hypothetical protein